MLRPLFRHISNPMMILLFISILPKAEAAPGFQRSYNEGEILTYIMTGLNDGVAYTAMSEGLVKRNSQNSFFEEFSWTDLSVSGSKLVLSSDDLSFRHFLSLDRTYTTPFPNISNINKFLIGPVFDLMTFYVDVQLFYMRFGELKPGDSLRIPHGSPNSWADGKRVIIGEDCIDFLLRLEEMDHSSHIAKIQVDHLPPENACVQFPADWMKKPVSDSANNWVQVIDNFDGTYTASVGKETFEVKVQIDTKSGKILSAIMDNPVVVIERTCKSKDLNDTSCTSNLKKQIHRLIKLDLK